MSGSNGTPTSAALKKLASTLVSPLPPPGSVRQRKQTSTYLIPSTSNVGTPAKRGRPAKKQKEESEDSDELTEADDSSDEEEGDAGGTGTPRSGNGNKRAKKAINGEDLWTEEMDEVLKRGMKKIPKMGRRSIVLESDGETYGRVGLLGEYLRRQTGKIRNRTQCASHMVIQRKHATKEKDKEMLELIDGVPLPSSQDLYDLDFDKILGPDRHPETFEAAAEENRTVKALRTALNDARRSGGGGSVSGSARKRGRSAGDSARKKRKIEIEDEEESEDSDEEESSSEEGEEEKVEKSLPVKRKRGRPRKHPLPVNAPSKSAPSSTKKPKRQSTIPTAQRRNAPRRSTLPSKQDDDAEMSSDLSSPEESENERVIVQKKPLKPATSKKPKSSSPAKMDVDEEQDQDNGGTVTIRAQEPPQTGSWLFGGLKKIISWF